jgi:hypothetical protein
MKPDNKRGLAPKRIDSDQDDLPEITVSGDGDYGSFAYKGGAKDEIMLPKQVNRSGGEENRDASAAKAIAKAVKGDGEGL